MLVLGQAPSGRSGDVPDVLTMLRSHFAPDDGGQGDGETGGSGDGGAGSDHGSGTETGKDGTPFDAARAQRTIDRQTEELKALRAQAKELSIAQARLKEIDDASKSETERLASKASEAEQKLAAADAALKESRLQIVAERLARKLNFHDEEDAFLHLQRSQVEYDDAGQPVNAEKLLTDLAKAKPHLVKAEGDGAANGTGAGTEKVPHARPQSGGMTASERAQRDLEGLRATGRYSV